VKTLLAFQLYFQNCHIVFNLLLVFKICNMEHWKHLLQTLKTGNNEKKRQFVIKILNVNTGNVFSFQNGHLDILTYSWYNNNNIMR
jgi:hypothetical protein